MKLQSSIYMMSMSCQKSLYPKFLLILDRIKIEACLLGEKFHARSYSQKASINEEGDDSASKVSFSSLMLNECSTHLDNS